MVGIDTPDNGQVQRARGINIQYLPQEVAYSHSRKNDLKGTLWELCLESFASLRDQEAELARLEEAMADPQQAEKAIARYGPLQEAFELAGGYTYSARIRQVLTGLGFKVDEFDRPVEQLSGGGQTRALLAGLILEDPDVLILDEPTNHLDVEAIEWLESWLRDWPGAEVIVSHDRYFLDRVVDTIWDLTPHGVELYRGNYSSYVEQRDQRKRYEELRFRAQQKHIRREEEFIRRNIAGQKTRQAQGRRKRLERLLREAAIERPRKERSLRLALDPADRSGDQVLTTRQLKIGHPDADDPLFEVPELVLNRGECVALIGPNGVGKTTFLKTILGEIQPWSGEVNLGASLQIGYYAQAQDQLVPERTVLEEIFEVVPNLKQSVARDILAGFLFVGDDFTKPVRILSGGERGRLVLAKLALAGSNFLLLDEPTNHLDLPSQEILEDALAGFPGTILLVSHDRYLIRTLATQIWSIRHDEDLMGVVQGDYEAYLEALREEADQQPAMVIPEKRVTPAKSRKSTVEDLHHIEAQIGSLEREMEEITQALQNAGEHYEAIRTLAGRYADLEDELEEKLALWEDLARGKPLA
jgi:ATP-binding cassette subfamily F protein 3